MEPVIIALICAAAFGTVMALAAFIRQLILSRDKNQNDEAQRIALKQETDELEKMREQMQSNKRFDSHYKVLGANKDAIAYLDTKIEDILRKKAELVDRYAQVTIKEAGAIVDGQISAERKNTCDRLKLEIDEQIKFYETELTQLQERRKSLWDTHTDLQQYLLNQEKARNENLDGIYKQHTGMLEKIYMRHTEDSEHIAKKSIDAATSTFKMIIMAPIQFLLQYFNISTGISFDQSKKEKAARDDVDDAESEINDIDTKDDDVLSDDDVETAEDEEVSTEEEETEKDAALMIA